MKRELTSSSKDSYQPPNSSKKNPTLELFLKIEKPIDQAKSMQKIKKDLKEEQMAQKLQKTVKEQQIWAKVNSEISQQTNSNNSANNKIRKSDPLKEPENTSRQSNQLQNDQVNNCIEVPMSNEQSKDLIKTYLNPNWDYACQECHRDITLYTKIKAEDKIYCPGCAAQFVGRDYTVIRALHDESFIDFQHEKQEGSVSDYIWSLKDELLLIEASELYGLQSYEMIKKHMRTDHPIEQIRYQQEYFIKKFLSAQKKQKEQKNVAECHSVNIQVDISSSDESTDEKFDSLKDVSKRNKKILKLFKYNQKTGEFDYPREPGFYELIGSLITKEDLKDRPQMVELVISGRQNEIQQIQILHKALKRKLLSKNALSQDDIQDSKEVQYQKQQTESRSEQIFQKQHKQQKEQHKNRENENDQEDIKDGSKQEQSNEGINHDTGSEQEYENECKDDNESDDYMNPLAHLTEKEKQTLAKCQLISQYHIKDSDTNPSLQKILEKIKLIDQRHQIIAQVFQDEKNIKQMLEKKKNIKFTIRQFRRALPPDVIAMIYKRDELEEIDQKIKKIDQDLKNISKI